MTTVINAPRALELLKQLVEEKGRDHKYQKEQGTARCLYWHKSTDECGCIVGAALQKAGVTPDKLIGLDEHRGGARANYLPFRDLGDVRVTEAAADVFSAAQLWQDGGDTWGYAVDQAQRVYNLHRYHNDEPDEPAGDAA